MALIEVDDDENDDDDDDENETLFVETMKPTKANPLTP